MQKNRWKFFSTEYIADRIAHSKLGQLLVMLDMFTMNSSSIYHSISTNCSNLLYTYIHAHTHTHTHTYIYIYIYIYIHTHTHTHTHTLTLSHTNTYICFTDSVSDSRQMHMKQDSIIIRQHTHARDKGQQSQQNTLHKNRQYNTSIYNNLNAKT